MIRIRNPWGNHVEWRGAWSDNSAEWLSISEELRVELEYARIADGEFWMSFDDFIINWHVVQICHLNLESFSEELVQTDDDSDLTWICTTYHSEWRTGISAGGCGSQNIYKYWTNPQFAISLQDVDEDDNEDMATVIISLMQKDTRIKRLLTGEDSSEEFIQFRLFRINDNIEIDNFADCHSKLYAHQLDRIGTSGSYINTREVTKRFRVPPGNYLIIPSTYDEDRDCEFMLRIFTEKVIESNDLDKDKDLNEIQDFFQNYEPVSIDWVKFVNFNNAEEKQGLNDGEKENSYYENFDVNPFFQNRKEGCFLM